MLVSSLSFGSLGSLGSLGCFPHNARNRTISEVIEGGLAISGVIVEGVIQSGADCNTSHAPGEPAMTCAQNASTAGGIGVALILAGVVGFIATISTAEEDKPAPVEIKAAPVPVPTAAPATGSPGTGSANPPFDPTPTADGSAS
ncbi:hypothetical protein BH11MYX1_BH11MYX1_33730 [soil metagenome]